MVYVWDYFMRRKPLLLAMIAAFALSSVLSGYFLRQTQATPEEKPVRMVKVAILEPEEEPEIEVPITGGEDELVQAIRAILMLK